MLCSVRGRVISLEGTKILITLEYMHKEQMHHSRVPTPDMPIQTTEFRGSGLYIARTISAVLFLKMQKSYY